jgi:hypothetical protein
MAHTQDKFSLPVEEFDRIFLVADDQAPGIQAKLVGFHVPERITYTLGKGKQPQSFQARVFLLHHPFRGQLAAFYKLSIKTLVYVFEYDLV